MKPLILIRCKKQIKCTASLHYIYKTNRNPKFATKKAFFRVSFVRNVCVDIWKNKFYKYFSFVSLFHQTMLNQTIECYTNQSRFAIETTEMLLITIFPLAYAISGVFSIVCAYIFSSNISKNNIYRYLTISSIVDVFYSLVLVVVPFSKCNVTCTWIADVYQKYVFPKNYHSRY